MKRQMSLCLVACVALVVTGNIFAQTAVENINGTDYFPLNIRGPLNIYVNENKHPPEVIIFFKKNPTKSGDMGRSLQPGSGAWLDRRISNDEPMEIIFNSSPDEKLSATFMTFVSCLGQKNCVVQFAAANTFQAGNAHYMIDEKYIRIYFPEVYFSDFK